MAKISKFDFNYETKNKYLELDVEYTTTLGSFFIRVPEFIMPLDFDKDLIRQLDNVKSLPRGNYQSVVIGENEEDVKNNFRAFVRAFDSLQEKVIDVIVYKLDYSATVKYEGGKGAFGREEVMSNEEERRHYDTPENAEIKLDWFVGKYRKVGEFEEYIIDEKKIYSRDYTISQKRFTLRSNTEWNHIPYSKQAEEFFLSFDQNLKMLIQNIHKYLGNDKLIKSAIKKGVKLLEV